MRKIVATFAAILLGGGLLSFAPSDATASELNEKPPAFSVDVNSVVPGLVSCANGESALVIVHGDDECSVSDRGGDIDIAGIAAWCPSSSRCLGARWDDAQLIYPSTCRTYQFEILNTMGYTIPYVDVTLARTNGDFLVEVYELNLPNNYYQVWPIEFCRSDLVDGKGPYEIQFWYSLDGSTFFYESARIRFVDAFNGTFRDDDGNTHERNIEMIRAAGITYGCNPPTQDRYCPRDNVTRGQMAAFLRRALNLPTSSKDFFKDDNGTTFERDINALRAAGITFGCNPPANDKFCPGASVTREQMAAFLVRAFGYPESKTNFFRDDNGRPLERSINALAQAGVTYGCNPPDNTRFCPQEPVKRDQMASFFARALNL